MTTDSIMKEALAVGQHQISAILEAVWRNGYAQGDSDRKAKLRALLAGEDDDTAGEFSVKVVPQLATESDGIPQIVQIGLSAPTSSALAEFNRQRAPRGLPRQLIDAALASSGSGVQVEDILVTAKTDLEKMVAASSIRSELRKGRDAGKYHEHNGRWHATKQSMPGFHNLDQTVKSVV